MSDYVQLREERPALHPRRVRPRIADGSALLVYLAEGTVLDETGTPQLAAPAYCYWPHPGPADLTLGAGTRAVVIGLGDGIRQDAIGARSESLDLRLLTDAPFIAPLPDPQTAARAEVLMDWFLSETRHEEARSTMLLASILRLILIEARRLRLPGGDATPSKETDLLRHFRHLVETHYLEHWQVADYAQALGVSYDRLHRLCRTELARSPADLVNQRLTAEACDRLDRSGAPLKKIASDLGFPDASRFSHYFKRRTGLSPGAWRAVAQRSATAEAEALRKGFADWP
ncbi:AraC family transcriptional regulator [Salipiger manganoxidans]|uniref:helix-turn-helix transcriptional regulator n=1 Tax=Salipiger marinus TaxID=555512 RepID=UPI001E630632|nr:AraC family transcriptional regulator [Salipiger manganoxidans]MCD1618747.1 AraC family transcriptional regulator [Salipiger manganoxidans]